MKNKLWLLITLALSSFLFMSFSPSLDGRAVVADEGVLPQGIFAKTVGYLPGDSISVTNLSDKTTVDILVIGALDPSEGVAILLSPEAAKVLGISKNSNNVVKITKRSGQIDEAVAGTAVIGNTGASKTSSDEELELDPPVEKEDFEEETVAPVEEEQEPLSKPLESEKSEVIENKEEAVNNTEETAPAAETVPETPVAEPVAVVEPEKEESAKEKPAEVPADTTEQIVEEELAKEAEEAAEEAVKADDFNEKTAETEIAPQPVAASEEKNPDELTEKIVEDTKTVADDGEVKSERITADGEVYKDPEVPSEVVSDNNAPVFYDEEIASEKVTPDNLDEVKVVSGPEKEVSQVPFEEKEVPENYDAYLEKLKAEKQSEQIYAEKVQKDNIDEFGNTYEYNDAPIEVTDKSDEEKAAEENIEDEPSEEKVAVIEETEKSEKAPLEKIEAEPKEANPDIEPLEKATEVAEKVSAEDENSEENETYEPIVLVPAAANPPVVEETSASEKTVAAETAAKEPAKETVKEPVKETVKPAESKKVKDFSKYTVESLKDLKSGSYYIQIAVLGSKENIQNVFDKYLGKYPIVLVPLKSGASVQVLIGPLNVDEYGTVLQRFKSYGYKDAFLRKIK